MDMASGDEWRGKNGSTKENNVRTIDLCTILIIISDQPNKDAKHFDVAVRILLIVFSSTNVHCMLLYSLSHAFKFSKKQNKMNITDALMTSVHIIDVLC